MTMPNNVNPIHVLVLALVLAPFNVSPTGLSDKVDAYSDTVLDLKRFQGCPDFHSSTLEYSQFWNSQYFHQILENTEPKQLKEKLGAELEDAARVQVQFITEYYKRMNELILGQYEEQEQLIIKKFVNKNIEEFMTAFTSMVIEKNCDGVHSTLQKYYSRIEEAGGIKELTERVLTAIYEPQFYINYYLFIDDMCKDSFIEPLLGNYSNAEPYFTKTFQNQVPTPIKNFINDKKLEKNGQNKDYLLFIDHNTVKLPDVNNSHHYIVDKYYIPIERFSFLFTYYNKDDFDVFTILYDIVNEFRLHRRLSNLFANDNNKLIEEFKKYIDAGDFGQNDAYYFIAGLLLADNSPTSKDIDVLRQGITLSSRIVNKYIHNNPNLKDKAKEIIKKNSINLIINNLYNTLDEAPTDSFNQVFRKEVFGPNADDGDEELEEAIEQIHKSQEGTDKEKFTMITTAIYEIIFKYFLDNEKLEKERVDRYTAVVKKLAGPLDLYNPDTIGTILKAIDSENKDLYRSYENMRKFFSTASTTKLLIEMNSKLDANNYSGYCDEIQFDFAIYGRAFEPLCPNVQVNRYSLDVNYLERFVKLLGFVRIFRFYSEETYPMISYIRMYRIFALNKYKYSLASYKNNIPHQMDILIENLANINSPEFKKYNHMTHNTITIREMLKIVNLANLDIKNHAAFMAISFDSIDFANMSRFIRFYGTDNRNKIDELLKDIHDHYHDSERHYHYNNIYMVLKIHSIVTNDESLNNVETSSVTIGDIVQAINISIKPEPSKLILDEIKVERRAALFFYIEYIEFVVEENEKRKTSNGDNNIINANLEKLDNSFVAELEKLAKDDMRLLEHDSQISLMRTYVIPQLPLVFGEKDPNKILINSDFKHFIINCMAKLKHAQLQQFDIYKYTAVDYFKVLLANQATDRIVETDHKEIIESGVLDVLIDNAFELHHVSKASMYYDQIQVFGDFSKSITKDQKLPEELNNILLVVYFVTVDVLRDLIVDANEFDSESALMQRVSELFDDKITLYQTISSTPDVTGRSVFGFDIEHLIFSAKLLFNRIYNHDKITIDIKGEKEDINLLFGEILLRLWDDGQSYFVASNRLSNMDGDMQKVRANYTVALEADKDELSNAFKDMAKNVLEPVCLDQVFGLVIRDTKDKPDIDFLKKTANACLEEKDNKQLLGIIQRLLKDVQKFTSDKKTSITLHEKVKDIFDEILQKAKERFTIEQILYLVSGVIQDNKRIYYNKDFQTFIATLTDKYTIEQFNKHTKSILLQFENVVSSDRTSLFKLDADEKRSLKNQFIKDIILLYDPHVAQESHSTSRFKLDHFDSNKLNLWAMLSEHSRFASFFTKLFAGFDKNTSKLDDYITLYLFINSFRVKYLSAYEIWQQGDDKTTINKAKASLAAYIDKALIEISDPILKANIFFLNIMFKMNVRNETDGKALKPECQTFKRIASIVHIPLTAVNSQTPSLTSITSITDYYNINELKSLVNDNDKAKKFLVYLRSTSSSVFKDLDKLYQTCSIQKTEIELILKKWTDLHTALIGDNESRLYTFDGSYQYSEKFFRFGDILEPERRLIL